MSIEEILRRFSRRSIEIRDFNCILLKASIEVFCEHKVRKLIEPIEKPRINSEVRHRTNELPSQTQEIILRKRDVHLHVLRVDFLEIHRSSFVE